MCNSKIILKFTERAGYLFGRIKKSQILHRRVTTKRNIVSAVYRACYVSLSYRNWKELVLYQGLFMSAIETCVDNQCLQIACQMI